MFSQLNKKGFTLVEIMIVIAIIGLLAAIAIPNLLRARINNNEAAVKAELRTFSAACESYRAAQTTPAYPATIALLTTPTAGRPAYLDASWNTNPRHGYNMTYLATANTFSLLATHIANSSINDFCIDQSGVIVSGTVGATMDGCTGTPIGG